MIVNLLPTTPTDRGTLIYSADSRGFYSKPQGGEIGAIRKRLEAGTRYRARSSETRPNRARTPTADFCGNSYFLLT